MINFEHVRKQPHSVEAEQSVLGALLLDNLAFDRVAFLLSESFYDPAHRALFAAISGLIAAGKAADPITVHEACGHDLAYLNALMSCVPSAANAHRYAAIVQDRALERALIREAGEVADLAVAPGVEIEAKLDQAQARFAKLGERKTRREPVSIESQLGAFIGYVEGLAAGSERVIGTGFRALDRLTSGGIRPGDLWVLGARPSMGKTALTLAMARHIGESHGTLFLSQEMPVMQLTMRHAAAVGRINLAHLRKPDGEEVPQEMWGSLLKSVERLRTLNLVMDDQGAMSLHDVRRKVMSTRRVHGLDVVFVDYLQLMQGDGENRNQELDRISNGLKAMALEFDVGVVLLSQMSRKADERSGPPVMSDLRDSGAIEAAADLIGMLHRDFVRSPTPENKHHAQLEIVKQRAGPPGTAHLWFDGAFQQFSDWPEGSPLPFRGLKRRDFSEGLA